jgi:transcriptional regulator with XRE-family HTH domain
MATEALDATPPDHSTAWEGLAELADVHPTFISDVERGYSAPTLYTLLSLAHALDVRPGQLVDPLASRGRR